MGNMFIQKTLGAENAFFLNPSSIEHKNQVLVEYFEEYLSADTNAEGEKIKLKIAIATYLSINARLIERYEAEIHDELEQKIILLAGYELNLIKYFDRYIKI